VLIGVLIIVLGYSVGVLHVIPLLSLSLSVQSNVSRVRSMLQTRQIGTDFIHIVKAVSQIIFKVGGWSVRDGNVVIHCHFLAGQINGTVTASSTALVWSQLLMVFCPFDKSFGPKLFQ